MKKKLIPPEEVALDFLHEIGSREVAADPLHQVVARIVDFVVSVAKCDSCFVYVLESGHLILRASKNPHPQHVDRLKLPLGQGITGWVAAQRKPVAVSSNAWADPRFRGFSELPEDRYEAFLSVPILCRDRLVGVINLQHVRPHVHTPREIELISNIGLLVGAEIEMARLEEQYLRITLEPEPGSPEDFTKASRPRVRESRVERSDPSLNSQSRRKHSSPPR